MRQNGVNNVPVMITEDKYLINGVQPQSVMKHTIEEIATKENIQLTGLQQMGSDADSYRQVDGRGYMTEQTNSPSDLTDCLFKWVFILLNLPVLLVLSI